MEEVNDEKNEKAKEILIRIGNVLKRMTDALPKWYNPPTIFPNVKDLNLIEFEGTIDKHLYVVKEVSHNLMEYTSPLFRATATIEIPPLPEGVHIQVGWVQVVTKVLDINRHGDKGIYSWEIAELNSGQYEMINDSTGRLYPWCKLDKGFLYLEGPTHKPTTTTLEMDDQPSTKTSWSIIGNGKETKPSLTFLYSKKKFISYLVFRNCRNRNYQVIRALTWSTEVALDINPENPLGQRVQLIGPCNQETPKVLSKELTPYLEDYALKAPNANECLMLVFRSDDETEVKKLSSTSDNSSLEEYLDQTIDYILTLDKITKSNFLLQYIENANHQKVETTTK